jgi:transposase
MRCSGDLRKRVIDFARGGGSKAEAARRFQVGRASVYRWVNAPEGLRYSRPGPRGPRRLDWEALRRQVQEQSDMTQKQRARHFDVSRHCIWYALQKMGLSRKKRCCKKSCDGGGCLQYLAPKWHAAYCI